MFDLEFALQTLSTQQRYPNLKRLMLIGAHPDDVTYCGGGIIAVAKMLGYEVLHVVATRGGLGSVDQISWPLNSLEDTRTKEQLLADELLGVDETIFLDYPDGGLDRVDSELAISELQKLMIYFNPTTIITFDPRNGLTGHTDHREIGRWTTEALSRLSLAAELLYIAVTREWYESTGRKLEMVGALCDDIRPHISGPEVFALDLVLPIEVLSLKLAAALAHESQSSPLIAALGPHGGFEAFREWLGRETYLAA